MPRVGYADGRPLKVPKRKGRKASACSNCRGRKQKCNGECPCNHCLRRNVVSDCLFPLESQHESVSPRQRAADTEQDPPGHSRSASEASEGSGKDTEDSFEADDLSRGRLWHAQGRERAPEFYGSSYFGPQVAARIISGKRRPSDSTQHGPYSARPERRTRPFISDLLKHSKVSQIREFLTLLPRRSTCDSLVHSFFLKYNDHSDAIYAPDFDEKYRAFWNRSLDYDAIDSTDLRWLALLFIIMAFGVLLEWQRDEDSEGLQDREDASWGWYWASRRAIVLAPTFYGESLDIVRAGCLVTCYLVNARRVPEAWLTISTAVRFAQAQGLHIDGSNWRLSFRESELRRRLWCHLYVLDRSISLFLGRPLSIQDHLCSVSRPGNLTDEELELPAPPAMERPLSMPTKTTFLLLHYDLTMIIGQMQVMSSGLQRSTYESVLSSEAQLQQWTQRLPPHFRLDAPDRGLDHTCPFLIAQRLSLHSKYHLARISLHRPFLLRSFVSNEFSPSREAAVTSAFADLSIRLALNDADLLNRFKYMTVASGFHSAICLGILLVREPHGPHSARTTKYLSEYLAHLRATPRQDEHLTSETRVLALCLEKAARTRVDERHSAERSTVDRYAPPSSHSHVSRLYSSQSSLRQQVSDPRLSAPYRTAEPLQLNSPTSHSQTSTPPEESQSTPRQAFATTVEKPVSRPFPIGGPPFSRGPPLRPAPSLVYHAAHQNAYADPSGIGGLPNLSFPEPKACNVLGTSFLPDVEDFRYWSELLDSLDYRPLPLVS